MIDANLYKQVMRRYGTGVMVLTIRDGENFHAVTVNSVTSVSLEPILLLVCLEKNARSHELLQHAKTFALMILSDVQAELGKRFAYDRAARNTPREQAATRLSERGELLFEETLAFCECQVVAEYEGGDHTIFMGEVVNAGLESSSDPLIYFESQWLQLKSEVQTGTR
jgi:flavin reductase (DIM6/NTAB) family NADH-FMN oxidoreductase RutF